ncbi:MAG: phosphatase PAP2 family protein, partial [Acidimicrobiia bacterium]
MTDRSMVRSGSPPFGHTDRKRIRKLWILAGGAAVLAAAWVFAAVDSDGSVERGAFRFINRLPDWLERPVWPIMQAGALLAAPALAAVALLAWHRWRPAVGLLIGGTGAWLAARAIKEIVGRGRPGALFEDAIVRHVSVEGGGFVSGHTATAFALAAVASPYLSRRWRPIAWGLAAAAGLARVYVGAHLLLDTAGGAALGVAIGAAVGLLVGRPRPEIEP